MAKGTISGSDLRRAIALARHRAPKCCTRRVIFSAPWSTHKQTRSKESDFSLSYSSLCPPKESDLSLSCHFQNLSTVQCSLGGLKFFQGGLSPPCLPPPAASGLHERRPTSIYTWPSSSAEGKYVAAVDSGQSTASSVIRWLESVITSFFRISVFFLN